MVSALRFPKFALHSVKSLGCWPLHLPRVCIVCDTWGTCRILVWIQLLHRTMSIPNYQPPSTKAFARNLWRNGSSETDSILDCANPSLILRQRRRIFNEKMLQSLMVEDWMSSSVRPSSWGKPALHLSGSFVSLPWATDFPDAASGIMDVPGVLLVGICDSEPRLKAR